MIEDNDIIFADFDDFFQPPSEGSYIARQRSISAPNERELTYHPAAMFSTSDSTGTAPSLYQPGHHHFPPPPGYHHPFIYPSHPSSGVRHPPMYPHPYHFKGAYPSYPSHASPYMYAPHSAYYSGPHQTFPSHAPFQPPLHYPPAQDQTLALGSYTKDEYSRSEGSSPTNSSNRDATKASSSHVRTLESKPSALLLEPSPSLPPEINKFSTDGDMDDAYKKPMTREQFYKIRPKLPRITKGDPRRSYAAAFAEAYNSCDFEKIWEFVSTYCTKDILFIHRWVGSELYLNFPKYLEVRGLESVSEYWFSRCVIVPDLVLEMKETKLYVRSDGISTVLSSFTIVCTRLYDGEVSDSLICRPQAELASVSQDSIIANVSETNSKSGETDEEGAAEKICNRVFNKLNKILLQHTVNEKRKGSSDDLTKDVKRRKLDSTEDKIDLFEGTDMTFSDISVASEGSVTPRATTGSGQPVRKRMPSFSSITLLGTVTLHLNTEQKIRQIDLTFALQQ